MTLSVAIQMDPIGSINPQRDSTLLMGLEAQRRGYTLYYYTPDKLTYKQGTISAQAYRIAFFHDPSHYHELGEQVRLDLSTMDVVLLRQDPPFNMEYITTTYLLERLMPGTFVTNHPGSVRDLPEKLFPTLFSEFMPPTLITADIAEIEAFRHEYKDVVIKPLYGFSGQSVFRLQLHEKGELSLAEKLFAENRQPWIVQSFLPEVKTGDRRIILIDGEIGGIMARIPIEGEIRANFRFGASPAKAEITPKQREICEALKPALQNAGILFAGIDVIGDWLTEINITSPTGLPAMNKLYGLKLESSIWDAIEGKLTSRKR